MSMRRFKQEEAWVELEQRYGCSLGSQQPDGSTDWLTPEGKLFSFPDAEEPDGCYPDFMLDHIIKRHGLERLNKPMLKTVNKEKY